jgi:hypothetical protein
MASTKQGHAPDLPSPNRVHAPDSPAPNPSHEKGSPNRAHRHGLPAPPLRLSDAQLDQVTLAREPRCFNHSCHSHDLQG